MLLPLFFSGRGGKTRAGHPASQNLAELAVKLAKEVAAKKGVTKSEIEFLLAFEKQYGLATECPSDIHGFLGPIAKSCAGPRLSQRISLQISLSAMGGPRN